MIQHLTDAAIPIQDLSVVNLSGRTGAIYSGIKLLLKRQDGISREITRIRETQLAQLVSLRLKSTMGNPKFHRHISSTKWMHRNRPKSEGNSFLRPFYRELSQILPTIIKERIHVTRIPVLRFWQKLWDGLRIVRFSLRTSFGSQGIPVVANPPSQLRSPETAKTLVLSGHSFSSTATTLKLPTQTHTFHPSLGSSQTTH